jgi:predicted TIM-barrel fold metal-dependent hydrolase
MNRRAAMLSVGSLLARREGIAKASQPRVMVDFRVPKGACDCHTHIFGDAKNFPMWAGRSYTPPKALPREMAALHRALGVERVVIVTPSVYGTDNSSTEYGLKARRGTSRGIAVIDDKTSDAELKRMKGVGFCGVRVNAPRGIRLLVERALERVAGLGWHLQVYSSGAELAGIEDLVLRSPVPVVVDHVAGAKSPDEVGFVALMRMMKAGKAYVKVTNRFMTSGGNEGMVKALLAANAERVLWGTDWPHPDNKSYPGRKPTDVSPFEELDDAVWLNQFAKWGGGAQQLVENPARLYGF